MSCNITAGIAKGCNDQVGGIVGIHYLYSYPDLIVQKDTNGVIIRVHQQNTAGNYLWHFIDTSNSQANVTETYNINQNGSILGFHQSANFFLPTTATPSVNNPSNTLQNFVDKIAPNNDMVVAVETGDNGPMESYSKKCFVFGLERPAYTVGGSKETGITYTDNNGYTLELGADSKEPMQEIAYMALHSYNLVEQLYVPNGDTNLTTNTVWQLDKVAEYEGANISFYEPGGGLPPLRRFLIVQPGETVSYEIEVTADWSADAFSGTTFLPQLAYSGTMTTPFYEFYNLDTAAYPLPTAPGVATLKGKGTFTNTTSAAIQSEPVIMRGTTPTAPINMNTPPYVPQLKFLTITRTT